MKLNRKGYMLVEIIVAATIAFSIAYYLLNLTYKFKSKSEDLYNQTPIVADKINITKNIMNDLDGKKIISITVLVGDANDYYFVIKVSNPPSDSLEYYKLIIFGDAGKIEYCTSNNIGQCQDKSTDEHYYEKVLDSNIKIGKNISYSTDTKNNIKTFSENNKYVMIKVPLLDSYGNKQEEIKLIIG